MQSRCEIRRINWSANESFAESRSAGIFVLFLRILGVNSSFYMRIRRKLRIRNDRSSDNNSYCDRPAFIGEYIATFFPRVRKIFTPSRKRLRACQSDAIPFHARYLLNILFRNIRRDSAFDIVENSHFITGIKLAVYTMQVAIARPHE